MKNTATTIDANPASSESTIATPPIPNTMPTIAASTRLELMFRLPPVTANPMTMHKNTTTTMRMVTTTVAAMAISTAMPRMRSIPAKSCRSMVQILPNWNPADNRP